MSIEQLGAAIALGLGVMGFFWQMISFIINIVSGKKKQEADTYKSLVDSIEGLNQTVMNQSKEIDKLRTETIETKTQVKTQGIIIVQQETTIAYLESNMETWKGRVTILEEDNIRLVNENKKLALRLAELEHENKLLREELSKFKNGI